MSTQSAEQIPLRSIQELKPNTFIFEKSSTLPTALRAQMIQRSAEYPEDSFVTSSVFEREFIGHHAD